MTPFTQPVLPAELTALRSWLVWRLVHIEGQPKPRKIPYYVSGAERRGTQGDEADRAALATFGDAVDAMRGGDYTGLGLAMLPDNGVVALDFDHCVSAGVIDPRIEALCDGSYTEISPSGNGVRCFMAGTLMSRKDVDAKHGPFAVEVFGHNGYVTVTGNTTETCRLFGYEETLAPLTPAVLQMYRARWGDERQAASDGGDLMALSPAMGFDNAKIAILLGDLPGDMSYDDWVKVGMAVHHETSGKGFDLWHQWSLQSPKYTSEKYCRDRWQSMGRYTGGASITMAWVAKQANEANKHRKYEAVKELRARITDAPDEFTLREKVCPLIAKDERVGDLDREALAQALVDQFRSLGAKYPVGQVRKLIAPPRAQTRGTGIDLPDWLTGWVYVTDDDQFFRLDTDEWLSMQGFNAKHNRFMPRGEEGDKVVKMAGWVALEDYQIKDVTRAIYLPWAGAIFNHQGVECANSYRRSSVPLAVDVIGQGGREAVAVIERHIRLLTGGRDTITRHLLAWMAHNVQHPGVKIRWAPLIKGVEGDGKTFLGNLMQQVMGHPNVKLISPKVLGTSFSDWAHGACVGVLEEIKMTGHNRHDIMNAVKEYITNTTVTVHPKGSPEYNVVNTMNYIAFTNHSDALPINETDRRWMVVFTPNSTTADLHGAIRDLAGMEPGAYFNALFAAITSHAGDIRRWLLDYAIPESFRPNSDAPMTEEKMLMVHMSASAEEEAVREIIRDGAEGVTGTVLSAACLVEAVALNETDITLQTTVLNRLLTRLGWQKVEAKVKWKGRSHRMWVKGKKVPSSPDQIRAALETSVQETTTSVLDIPAVDLF